MFAPALPSRDAAFALLAARGRRGRAARAVSARPAAQWIQCSYNTVAGSHTDGGTPFRANYPNIGDIWDSTNEIFHAPQPYNSWTLNTSTGLWDAPIPMPNTTTTINGSEEKDSYNWDESAYQADNATGWIKATPGS